MRKISKIIYALPFSGLLLTASCGESSTPKNIEDVKDSISVTQQKSMPADPLMDSAAKMKAWVAYMTPGDMHRLLASDNGTWNEDITYWETPGGAAKTTKVTGVSKMILGGRYQHSTHAGTFEGQPFEGINIIGFDNAKKMFVSTWVDNMSSGTMTMEGKWDSASRSIELKGKGLDPTTGKDMDMREVIKIVDDKTRVHEMYMVKDGNEFKHMEIKCTKR